MCKGKTPTARRRKFQDENWDHLVTGARFFLCPDAGDTKSKKYFDPRKKAPIDFGVPTGKRHVREAK